MSPSPTRAQGDIFKFTLRSTDSKLYPAWRVPVRTIPPALPPSAPWTRTCPCMSQAIRPGTAAPFMVTSDGDAGVQRARSPDPSKKVPVMVVVAIPAAR